MLVNDWVAEIFEIETKQKRKAAAENDKLSLNMGQIDKVATNDDSSQTFTINCVQRQ